LVDFDRTTRRIVLHDLLHSFATGLAEKHFGSLANLHLILVDAYRDKCTNGWVSGPNDGYFFQNLVGHLLMGGRVNEVVILLADLRWIEAKCKAGLALGLGKDYRQTFQMIPEGQAILDEDRGRQARLLKYTRDLVSYSKGGITTLDIPTSVEPLSRAQIEAEAERIREYPTVVDRLNAFATFVEADMYYLNAFGTRPGFVLQHAFNSAPTGLVRSSSLEAFDGCAPPVLLKLWSGDEDRFPNRALLRTMKGPQYEIHGVALTPDGRLALSGWDENACLWDLKTGTAREMLRGHTRLVDCVAVTPDGRWAASGAYDKTVRVWDLDYGTCSQVLKGHRNIVDCVCITPDGRRVISGSWDKTLRVWNAVTGKCERILRGHGDSVSSIVVTADGRSALSGSWDTSLRVWDLESGRCLRVLEGHSDRVQCVDLTPDGRLAVSAGWDKVVQVWDLEAGQRRQTLPSHSGWISGISLTPDGRLAVSGGNYNAVRVWDLRNGTCVRTLNGHTFWVYGVGITADGRRAISAGGDETVREWDVSTGESVGISNGCVDSVAITRDGSKAVSAVDCTLSVWDVMTRKVLRALRGHADKVDSISLVPSGVWLELKVA
jgi:WD40 repeat protein